MASEDIVQMSDRAYLNVGVVGAVVTEIEKRGPIASITVPATGTLRVTLNQPIPNSQLMTLVNPYAPYCVLQTGLDENSTSTVKDFKFVDAAGVPLVSYGVRIVFSRRTSTSVSLLAEVEPEEQTVWLANWSPDLVRYVPISYTNGSDDNIGYIDTPANSQFDPAALRSIALKTIEEFLLRVSRQGNGLRLVALLEGDPTAAAPTSYFDKDGISLSVIDLSGISGYTTFLIRASDFTNSAADQLRCATYVKQAGPGTGGRWTVQSWAAPKITTTSATLSTTFGTLEGCSIEFDGNVTAALATKGGIVKAVDSSSVVNVGIGSAITQTAPVNGDTFLITAPSVKTGPVQGGQSNLSIGATANSVTSRFPGTQVVGIEMANPGTYTNSAVLRLLCNQIVFSKCLLSGFVTGRFSSGDGFAFLGSYFNESGSNIETGHSFAFNAGAGSNFAFTGVGNVVPNAPSSTICNVVFLGSNASNINIALDGIFGSSSGTGNVNSALLTRSAIHGPLQIGDVRLSGPAQSDQAAVGGANGVYDQLALLPRSASSIPISIYSGNNTRLCNIAVGQGVDGVRVSGKNNSVEFINVVNYSVGTLSGYGVNCESGTRVADNNYVDGGGNTVLGTLGEVFLYTANIFTWAALTQGLRSPSGTQWSKRGQTVGSFQKLTIDTLANMPILGADPAAPKDGDVWATDIAGVRSWCVRIGGATYRSNLV